MTNKIEESIQVDQKHDIPSGLIMVHVTKERKQEIRKILHYFDKK